MGCDIHMYTEFKDDGQWKNCDHFMFNPYFEPEHCETYLNSKYQLVPFFGTRCYDLFSVLANVRNYADTDYIDEPRGLPEDVTPYVKSEYENWDLDAHSTSYFTLKELIDFHNENHPMKRCGMFAPEDLKAFDKYGIIPNTYCQYTNRPGWGRRTWETENDVLIPIIEKLKERADELNLIYSFYWDGNEETRKRAYEASENIRIVFWFDN